MHSIYMREQIGYRWDQSVTAIVLRTTAHGAHTRSPGT